MSRDPSEPRLPSAGKTALYALLLILSVAAFAQNLEVGPPFPISAGGLARIAIGPSEHFIVVWNSGDIFGQLYEPDGLPIGQVFQINNYPTAHQAAPQEEGDANAPNVGIDAAGNFVVAWPSAAGVAARRFSSSGEALGAEFTVAPPGSYVDVHVQSSGDFLVTWFGGGRLFESSGDPKGDAFPIPGRAVGMTPSGEFVVAWEGGNSYGYPVMEAQRYDSNGIPVGESILVSTVTTEQFVTHPAVAMSANGDFVIAWAHFSYGGTDIGNVAARLFNSDGTPVGDEFLDCCNGNVINDDPVVAMDAEGTS